MVVMYLTTHIIFIDTAIIGPHIKHGINMSRFNLSTWTDVCIDRFYCTRLISNMRCAWQIHQPFATRKQIARLQYRCVHPIPIIRLWWVEQVIADGLPLTWCMRVCSWKKPSPLITLANKIDPSLKTLIIIIYHLNTALVIYPSRGGIVLGGVQSNHLPSMEATIAPTRNPPTDLWQIVFEFVRMLYI